MNELREKLRNQIEEFLNYNTLYLSGKQIAALFITCALFFGGLFWICHEEGKPANLKPVEEKKPATAAPGKTKAKAMITVYVCGQVKKPGVYKLEKGARVVDVIKIASGTTPKADLNAVNLATKLLDGEKIYIPARGEGGISGPASGSGGSSGGPVDLNFATADELNSLPGIGPVLADKIIAHRKLSPFRKVSDLKKVEGIGEKKFSQLKDLVIVR